jgi:ABC-type multidrug transport system fused ATPase/permease subunit
MVKIRYNAAHAKVSADRYNILTNFDIIKSYNREVEDVNTMDKNLLQMTNYGNRSNFLSAISGYSSRIVMVLPSGILYYIIMKYDIISTVSTGEEFVAYNGIFCMLKAKLNSLRVDLVRIGQYSVDLDSSDYDKMPRDIDNALLYYNYTDNKVNNRDPFTNVEFSEHETDQLAIYNDVGVRIGFNINKNVPLTSSRCISEKTVVVDDFDKNESIKTFLDFEKAFVFNDKIIFRDLLVKANRKVLFRDANFTINRGEKIALVGKNGTGKSTLLDIILRFKDYEGVILVDGRNMNTIYKFDQRSKISYVPQKPGIISGSVLDNLRYHDYSIPQNIIEEKCSKYGYHELFSNLPNGYDTDVGENGKFLSGGQQQKISFMRGLIKDGDIFIMDEPTANLDPQSEIQVVSQIFKLMSSKTVITIIHKHSLLSGFDKILGIYNGKIHIYTDFDEFMKDSHFF